MRTMAVARDFAQLPAFMQQPAVLRHMAALPHDPACTASVMTMIVAAMAGEGSEAAR
jgi:hypothetical protein